MAGLSSPEGFSMEFVNLRRSKEDKKTYFFLNGKVNDSWRVIDKYTQFEGKLLDVEIGGYVYEGEQVPTISFFFEAAGKVFKIETGFNYTSRSLINTLAGNTEFVKNGDLWLIRFYDSKKHEGSDMWVCRTEHPKEKLPWHTQWEDQPQPKKVKFGNKVIIDDAETNEYFSKLLLDVLKPACPGFTRSSAPEQNTPSQEAPAQEIPKPQAGLHNEPEKKWPKPAEPVQPKQSSQESSWMESLDDNDLPF